MMDGTKAQIKANIKYVRKLMRELESVMREDALESYDWQLVADVANEASCIAGQVMELAVARANA